MLKELMRNLQEAKTSKTKAEIKEEVRTKLPKKYWDSIAEDALLNMGLYLWASTSDAQSKNYKQYLATMESMTAAYQRAVFDTSVELGYYRMMMKKQGHIQEEAKVPTGRTVQEIMDRLLAEMKKSPTKGTSITVETNKGAMLLKAVSRLIRQGLVKDVGHEASKPTRYGRLQSKRKFTTISIELTDKEKAQ